MDLTTADVTTVTGTEAVVHDGRDVRIYEDLHPDTEYSMDGLDFRTLAYMGEQYATVCTVNDLHFGETEAGKIEGSDIGPVLSSPPGGEPYPELMNRGAADEISSFEPTVVVAKGDLTADARPAEIDAFMRCYADRFGSRLVYTRGNHDVYSGRAFPSEPCQEVSLDGAVLAVLDTARPARANGSLDPEQLDWLDELAARSELPVLVFGHHPVWDPQHDQRSDDFFGLVPDATDQLAAVVSRRPNIAGYFAGHTHRNRVIHLPGCGSTPFAEVACVKDFPGSWAEYRICERGIVQVHRRIGTPEALEWSEKCREMYAGAYYHYAFGGLADRCFAFDENGLLAGP